MVSRFGSAACPAKVRISQSGAQCLSSTALASTHPILVVRGSSTKLTCLHAVVAAVLLKADRLVLCLVNNTAAILGHTCRSLYTMLQEVRVLSSVSSSFCRGS